jgi:hypothetical protein
MLSFALRLSPVVAALALVVACTTKNVEIRHSADGGTDGGGTTSNGPPIDAEQLGGACSGFGTGIGETAGFTTEDCAAGVCLVDARHGLDLYCSADCSNATCPDGWECQAVDHGVEHACFRVAGAGDGGTADAALPSAFESPLTGYRKGAKASTTFSISDLKDPSQIGTDLIVLVVAARWSTFDNALLQDLETASLTKTMIVTVVAEGASAGKAATKTDLDAWHAEYPAHAMVLDPELATLKTEIGAIGPGEIEAFPTLIGLDASTLAEVGREAGYQQAAELKAMLEQWRAKTK